MIDEHAGVLEDTQELRKLADMLRSVNEPRWISVSGAQHFARVIDRLLGCWILEQTRPEEFAKIEDWKKVMKSAAETTETEIPRDREEPEADEPCVISAK